MVKRGTRGADNGTVEATNLAAEIGSSTLGKLKDDGRFLVSGSLKGGYDSRGGSDIDGRYSKGLLLRVFEETVDIIAVDDTRLALEDVLTTHR